MALIVVGITGASGSIYGHRLIEHLDNLGHEVHLVCTNAGQKVSDYEKTTGGFSIAKKIYRNDDYFAAIASGSFDYQGLVIAPCSMGTLGKIAGGIGDNLLCRAADVRIKEKKKIILVPREMPYSPIHLENLLKLSRLGVTIIGANPHYYSRPQTIEDLVDTVLARILDQIGIPHEIGERWKGNS